MTCRSAIKEKIPRARILSVYVPIYTWKSFESRRAAFSWNRPSNIHRRERPFEYWARNRLTRRRGTKADSFSGMCVWCVPTKDYIMRHTPDQHRYMQHGTHERKCAYICIADALIHVARNDSESDRACLVPITNYIHLSFNFRNRFVSRRECKKMRQSISAG